jgi:replicative DNA helicase
MADIELELLSRAIMVGGIGDVIAADIEARHWFDPDTRAVFQTCVDHFAVWRKPLSLNGVKRAHPDFKIVPSTDELGYLIQEFAIDRGIKIGTSAVLDMHSLIEQAEMGDKGSRAEFIERFMEIARRVAAEAPGEKAERFSDMVDRVNVIRKQQEAGQLPGVSTGMPGLDRYVRSVNVGEFFVHCGFSSRGKTQGLVRSSVPSASANSATPITPATTRRPRGCARPRTTSSTCACPPSTS